MNTRVLILATLLAAAPNSVFAGEPTSSIVTFSNGSEGWNGPNGNDGAGGGTVIEQTGGNDGAYMRTVFNDFGITYANSTKPEYLGDYTDSFAVTISIDVRVEFLNFFGQDVSRPFLVDLIDFDTAQGGFPWSSVWFKFDDISQAQHSDWTTFSVTFDPRVPGLPDGWHGSGAEDPNTFESILPDGVTFADVLSGVDMIRFTTFEYGFFFGFTDHTIGIDNIYINRSEPACLADLNYDGVANFFDLSLFLQYMALGDLRADLNFDGDLNFFDVTTFISSIQEGCV